MNTARFEIRGIGVRLGMPVGIALVMAASRHGTPAMLPVSWLIAVLLGSLVAMAALAAVPARLGARVPPAEVLAETT